MSFAQRQAPDPVLWDSVDSVVGPRELTVDSPGGVSIVAKVHGAQSSFPKGVGTVKRPECSLKRTHHKPAADDLWWLLLLKRPVSNLGDCGRESMTLPIIPL